VLRTVYATLDDLKTTRGRLVLIGSVSGHVGVPGSSAYSMSKFAVHGLAGALGHELTPYGVAVTLISPGFVESDIAQVVNRGGWRGGWGRHTRRLAGAAARGPGPRLDRDGDADRGAKNRARGRAAASRSGDHGLRQGRGRAAAASAVALRGDNSTFRY